MVEVSVLMTCYNKEDFIECSIKSVLASTFSDFELIIVDDLSQDRSYEIAKKYENIDSRIKVFKNENNLGDYPNRNKAASYAQGKYIKYLDADDLIYPWGLEILYRSMENFPECGWGLCSLEQDEEKIYPFSLNKSEIYNYHFQKNSLFHKAGLSSIIKTSTFKLVGGFSGKRHLGDFELWLRLAGISDLVLMPHGVVWHRIHDQQESKANRSDEFIPLKYDLSLYKFLKNQKLIIDCKVRNNILKKTKKKIFIKALKFLIILKWNSFLKIVKEFDNDFETFS